MLFLSQDRTGAKMLRPNAQASACRTALAWESPAPRPVDAALQELHDSDPEANALRNVRLRTSVLSLGFVQRECVTVTADVVRTVPVLYVPSSGSGHERHQP